MRGIRRLAHRFKEWAYSLRDRGVLLFGVFFLVSLLMWFFQTFQYTYFAVVSIPVEYDEIPTDIAVSEELPKSLEVEISDNGFSLLRYRLSKTLSPIVLPVQIGRQRQGTLDWSSEQIEGELVKKFSSASRSFKIRSVSPSHIHAEYSPKAKKEVLIHLTAQIIPSPGVILTGVSMEPDQTIVYGSKSELDSLTVIPTEAISLDSVTGSKSVRIALVPPPHTTLTPTYTTLHITTERLVQVSFTMPIDIPSVSPRYVLRSFPSSVQVTCVVPESKVPMISDQDLHVTLKAEAIEKTPRGSLKVIIDQYPDFVQIIQSDPSEVEYLLDPK